MNHSNELDKIGPALVKLQGALQNPAFDATNPFFKSEYVSLAGLIDHSRDMLHDCGLAVVQLPVGLGGVETIIVHESGQWLSESAVFITDPKNPQEAVAAVSYGRRCGLAAVLRVAGEPDDDGNQASGRTPDKPAASYTPAAAPKSVAPPSPGSGLQVGPFTVLEVTHKEGISKKTGKPYTVFTVRFSDGAEAKTFDKGLANLAKVAAEGGAPVTRMIEKGGFGFDLTELKIVAQPEPEDDSQGLPF